MKIFDWTRLACVCGSTKFLKIVGLLYHGEGGTSEKVEGWQCRGCGEDVLMDRLIADLKRKQKEEELKALQEELDANYPKSKSTN